MVYHLMDKYFGLQGSIPRLYSLLCVYDSQKELHEIDAIISINNVDINKINVETYFLRRRRQSKLRLSSDLGLRIRDIMNSGSLRANRKHK